jgi:AcrR family transcriptional regulator
VPENSKANRGPSAGPANRAAIIAAARDIFAEDGFTAPLSAIARRAGVGQGSLYRHFPDRIALAVAVFDDNITALEELADAPDSTLSELFDSVAEQAISSTALIDVFTTERHDPRAEQLGLRVLGIIDSMLERDRAAGRIGDHVETADVMVAISMLAFLLSRTDAAERPDAGARARAMFRAAFGYRREP